MRGWERADDVLRMYRLARTGGTSELLRWLAHRAEGWAGLLDGDGTVLHAAAGTSERPGQEAAVLASEAVGELKSRGAGAYSLDADRCTALVLPLDGRPEDRAPVLAVVAPRPLPGGLSMLLADAMMPLTLSWAAETLERRRRRVDLAESRGREAVLHLLMTGQLSIAHQVAGALRPKLPDPVRVCVVECSGGQRDEVARICADASGGRTWIVRCPVYARHLILVMPAGPEAEPEPETTKDGAALDRTVAELVDDCVVGVSEEVQLSDTAAGYRQAFHALAVARGLPGRHARFGSSPEPALAGVLLACHPAPEDPPQHPRRPAQADRRAARPGSEPGRRPGGPRPGARHQGHPRHRPARPPGRAGSRDSGEPRRDPARPRRPGLGVPAAVPPRPGRPDGRGDPAYLAAVRGPTGPDRSRAGHLRTRGAQAPDPDRRGARPLAAPDPERALRPVAGVQGGGPDGGGAGPDGCRIRPVISPTSCT